MSEKKIEKIRGKNRKQRTYDIPRHFLTIGCNKEQYIRPFLINDTERDRMKLTVLVTHLLYVLGWVYIDPCSAKRNYVSLFIY